MESDFFARQAEARRQTTWLRLAFAIAIVIVALALAGVCLVLLGANPLKLLRRDPAVVFALALPILCAMAISSWRRWRQLREGGAAVARALGGQRLSDREDDPARRRLVNVVEEMALAARIPVPEVFLLPDEPGINAFAAGHSHEAAAVGITAGALENFDRDQLQAVVGHEFSHILNGDMALNTRLVAWLHGLMGVNRVANKLIARGRKSRSPRLLLAGGLALLVGSAGLLAGRLLQAAVSRRREHLADASAVQFTRNPEALKSAFVVMAAVSGGTGLASLAAPELAHMFVASAKPRRRQDGSQSASLFATHPPLAARVQRLDAQVTPERFALLVHEARRCRTTRLEPTATSTSLPAPTPAAGHVPRGTRAAAASTPVVAPALPGAPASTPLPDAERAARAASVRPAAADPMRHRLSREQQHQIAHLAAQVAADDTAVHALFVVDLLDADPARRRAQLARLAPVLGARRMQQVAQLLPRFVALPAIARLPLLTGLLPHLRTVAERGLMLQVTEAFARTVRHDQPHRYCVTRILLHELSAPVAPAAEDLPAVPVAARAEAIGVLLRAGAIWRGGVPRFMEQAYRAGLLGLLPPQRWPAFGLQPVEPAQLDAAIAALRELRQPARRAVIDGLLRVIAAERRLQLDGVELLRTAGLLLDCPIVSLPLDAQFEDLQEMAQQG